MTIRYKALLKLNKINIVVANEKHFKERQKYTCNMYKKKRPKPNGQNAKNECYVRGAKKKHTTIHIPQNILIQTYIQNTNVEYLTVKIAIDCAI